MEIRKSHIGNYFKLSVINLFKSKIIFFIITIIENVELIIGIIIFEELFFYYKKNYTETKTYLKNILLQISPRQYYHNYLNKIDVKGFDRNYTSISIYLFLHILFYLYLFFGTKEEKKNKHNMKKILDKICINFFDIIFFRFLPLYGFDSLITGILRISAKDSYNIVNILLQFILLLFFCLSIFTHLYYFRNVCIWNNFQIIKSYINLYPYDKFFSQKYDIIYFILKVFVSFCQCYLDYNNNGINIIVIFITFILIFIFYTYTLYTFYIIFLTQDCLYIYINFPNKLRIFFLLLNFEFLLLRIALHSSGDHIPYLVYAIILIIFNIYLVMTKFNEFLYTMANTSQNFLAVCWFIQSNEINNNDFIIEWISNHKNKCILESYDCPICSKLKRNFDIYSDEHLLELKKERPENQFLNFNNKMKNKSEITKVEKRTLISNMFPSFKFFNALINLAERYKKFMSKDDLIRLDFINLTSLFLNEEKEIDFIIFNRICHCLIKYQYNSQILMTFKLIFDLLRVSEKFCNQKYEILQKNEELRNSLTKYLKEYEEFILYKDKSPLNYYDISIKYKSFKDLLVTIHMYFKKNIECNYELILMRYIYETLINSKKLYHIQPFDLNNYSEFLEFHFTNSRILLMKYKIEQDLFLIIKASKEILKFQGNRFCQIFPEELRTFALNKFQSQLNNLDEKDSKHIFEFLIESNMKNYGFIESFKMNYVIYPTNLINELFIQANYRIGYTNLIIFSRSNTGEESLFSYSFQLYKYFGITPQDISLLSKFGVDIFFENIFNKKNYMQSLIGKEITKEDKYKTEYIFKYKYYIELLKRLLSFDIIKESSTYPQIKEKEKQFENLAKDDKEIIFQIYKKWECRTDTKKYNIYSIKEIKKKRLKKNMGEKELKLKSTYSQFNDKEDEKSGLEGEESELDDDDENNEFDYEENMFEGKGMTMAGSLLSSASFSKTSESMESSKQKGKKDEKTEEKKAKQQQLYKTVYVILGFGILLIIISIIFLIMENLQNSKFRNLVKLFHTFHIFKRGIESLPLTILSNYKYEIEDVHTNNLFDDYSYNLGKKHDLMSKTNLSYILLLDAQAKLSSIINAFNDYLKELHKLERDLSNRITNLIGKSYKLKVVDDKLYFYKLDTALISIGREYLNILSILLEENAFLNTSFYLMSAGALEGNLRHMDRSNIRIVDKMSKNMILLLLTYPFLHNGLFTISSFILNQSENVVKSITTIYIIFYAILFILHLILCGIGINFLLSFIKILKLSIMNGNKLFENKQFLDFQEKRLNQIKIMKNLYSENPIKIMDKIEAIDFVYKNKNNEITKKKTNDMQVLEYDKNYNKEEEKEKNGDHDLLSKTNSQKSNMNKKITYNVSSKNMFSTSLKTINTEANNKDKNNNDEKNEFNSLEISNVNQKITTLNSKMKVNQFYKIVTVEFIILVLSFSLYFIYSIIMLILVVNGINRLYNLINYINCNDLLDGYLYDNTNVLIYMINTNTTSYYYSSLIDASITNVDYIKKNIDLLYDTITNKEDIEQYKESIFKPVNKLFNINCASEIIQDESLIKIAKQNNINYDKYFSELCTEFPVASTGVPSTIFFEVIYLVGQIYRKYEKSDSFYEIFQLNLNQTQLFDLFTITLTFLRMQRNYFYNNIIMKEINQVMDYFSQLILIYLVISIIFEVVIFLLLYFGLIKLVKKKDSLFSNFIDSFRFD